MTRALVTKLLRALDASRDDVNECLNEILPKAGSYRYDRVIGSPTTKLTKHVGCVMLEADVSLINEGNKAQQAKQVPMTSDDIHAAYLAVADQFLRAQDERLAFAFARAIEAHHGITEGVA